ncbi:tRNA (adenosine(37)-N6)-dimethylallyltransferase MiaA [Staphylococcus pseudintermedius]|uniref:tRNA (adenosine(37)-N6)-dimethylallyltransferase MiaA n=1 Tax=Staphylococcus pseudintermedius TaxID=283734 RepID=UPI0028FD33A1|nr:tRNA (adenosine(37)-N6)-dimethylallyltransferase MiaA [Staphylococcus pseudintermedius]EHT3690651.1 tRNA (adenosine(37)-N6)-dimethylallyltransferase MiaA [Staphylococcus pseudintermedius]MCE5436531.1 tRNA (adenosine(37)-N6)-dimethylallyltransferase MiaA [Staphylococcus pseudintermedius]MCE5478616.1 tRNA (adenosine(37)-N6)-dimethylallyltransferase MiaA [Staphylococcus pseudintermedius]MCE5550595.1 tRNA (adenosine(37)-N6)-dimethylallyltransferase MiaA [Staphylococcus pseudintermedius]MDU02872
MSQNKPFIVAIVGPTASGKTELGVALAKAIDGEVISGDSMQVYQGMDIGTAKVTPDEMDGIPHHLIDILKPDETYSAYDFQQQAQQLITDITTRGKVPIIVGGTGLYIQSVIYDYQFDDETISPETEQRVAEQMAKLKSYTNEAIHDYLGTFDPISQREIHPNNRKRVERAISYYLSTKKVLSNRKKSTQLTENYDTLLVGIKMSRDTLYSRINSRVDMMLSHGLLDEVQELIELGYESCQSMQAIGYKEIIPVIKNEMPLDEAITLLKQHSRNYAKRQMTWFTNKLNVHWLDREKMSLTSMLSELKPLINKRRNEHD